MLCFAVTKERIEIILEASGGRPTCYAGQYLKWTKREMLERVTSGEENVTEVKELRFAVRGRGAKFAGLSLRQRLLTLEIVFHIFNPNEFPVVVERAKYRIYFREGFLHADPHPANLFILNDEVICFLDFGMVEYIEDKLLTDLTELLIALIHDNTGPRLAEELMNLHTGNKWDVDYPKLVLEMSTFIDRHFVEGKMPLAQKGVGYIMNELVYGAYKFGIKLPQPLILVIKTLLYVEMLANELYPGFDVMDMVRPRVDRRLRKKLIEKVDVLDLRQPKELVSDLLDAAGEAADFAKDLPRQVAAIMTKLERGELELKLKNNNNNNHLIWSIFATVVIIALLVIIILKI